MTDFLVLGQVDNAATPTAAAGKLYWLSDGYGASVGVDVPLLVESTEVAPLGPTGVCLFRRVSVPVEYTAGCTIAVTPIVDFVRSQGTTSTTLASPATRTVRLVTVPLSTAGTTCRVRVEVTARAGTVQIGAPVVEFMPKSGATSAPVGGA